LKKKILETRNWPAEQGCGGASIEKFMDEVKIGVV